MPGVGGYLQIFSRRAASMPAQSPEEQAFSKASQASCSLPSLRETAPRMFHTRYDLSSRRKASSRSLRAPAVFPCWSRQIPRERYASAEGSSRMAFVRSSKASSGVPELAQGQPAADQRLWVIGLDFQCFVKVFQRFFRVGTRLAFPKDVLLRKAVRPGGSCLPDTPVGLAGLGGIFSGSSSEQPGSARMDNRASPPAIARNRTGLILFISLYRTFLLMLKLSIFIII